MTNILLFILSIHFHDIALTFDDGPTKASYKLARMLRDNGIVAMFFPQGNNLDLYPDFADYARALGHKVGNHTYSHSLKNPEWEITWQHDRLGGAKWFRFPDGAEKPEVYPILSRLGYKGVMKWDLYSGDVHGSTYERSTKLIMLKPGIVLMHDCNPSVIWRVRHLLSNIKLYRGEKIYRFVDPERLVGDEV